jgi:hypothetical protein
MNKISPIELILIVLVFVIMVLSSVYASSETKEDAKCQSTDITQTGYGVLCVQGGYGVQAITIGDVKR